MIIIHNVHLNNNNAPPDRMENTTAESDNATTLSLCSKKHTITKQGVPCRFHHYTSVESMEATGTKPGHG